MNVPLKELCEKFVSKKSNYLGYEKSTVSNLLFGSSGKISIFIETLGDAYGASGFDEEVYRLAVKESVMSYSSKKDSAISIYSNLTRFLEKELDRKIEIAFPPIPVSNTFERLMFIAKYLQDEESNVRDLPDILWVNERTIEADLAKLRGLDDDPLQICGKEFNIGEDIERKDGHISFASTVHPFFLTCNLTQVIALIKSLDNLSREDEWKGYAESLACQIWQQLSDYGKNRTKYVLNELMPEDAGIVERLEREIENTFLGEAQCSNLGGNALLETLKNGKSCCIEYQEGKGTVFFENVRIKKYEENQYLVEVDGKEVVLEKDRIVRSAKSKDMIF